MALLVVLVPSAAGEVSLGSHTAEALARLGVTHVSLARDQHTIAVVLEGWTFDPSQPKAALSALGANEKARTLQPIAQMAVSAAPTKGAAPTPAASPLGVRRREG